MWMVSAASAAHKRFAEQNLKWAGFARPFESHAGSPRANGPWGAASNMDGVMDGVMDGDLDGFLNAYLTQLATGELKK